MGLLLHIFPESCADKDGLDLVFAYWVNFWEENVKIIVLLRILTLTFDIYIISKA